MGQETAMKTVKCLVRESDGQCHPGELYAERVGGGAVELADKPITLYAEAIGRQRVAGWGKLDDDEAIELSSPGVAWRALITRDEAARIELFPAISG